MITENQLEGQARFVSVADMKLARQSMETQRNSRIAACDYIGECPVTNALIDMVEHLEMEVEVGVDGEQAELYIDNPRQCFILPLTSQLRTWQIDHFNGCNAPVGAIHIFRDSDEKLKVGIDFNFANRVKLSECDLVGMEKLLSHRHIKIGIGGSCELCPVSIVLSEMFTGYEVHVDSLVASIHKGGDVEVEMELSEKVSNWIDSYDNENDVGSFVLVIKEHPDKEYLVDFKGLSSRQEALRKRISKLTVQSADMVLARQHGDYEQADGMLTEYQDLFEETVRQFG